MYWRDVVTLKAVTEGRDADGFPKETITETTVFADVSSTKRSEFYAARQAGISLALTVKLRAADYDGQERLSYEGKEYKVERAYTEAREYAAFHRNSKKDSEEEGKSSGTMLTEIGYIKGGIDRIERKQDAQDARYISMAERMSAVESSAKSAHHRIDRLEGREAREDG